MTRYDVLQIYGVRDGKIETPGAFEGQALYVPYFWQIYLSGNAHEVGIDDTIQFSVSEPDRIQFPELSNRSMVQIRLLKNKVVEV